MTPRVRSFAFYLPQFHPIPENDEWWGKGFTEWTNVTRTTPRFQGHQQPRLPADLGFYDLRLPEARRAQADFARDHGIDGFIYYHYWFNGRRLLERPFDEVLESGEPDFPFALCWANEDWKRNWDGNTGETLLQQQHSREDDLAHIEWLRTAFTDSRYIRVEGKPLFLIYRAARIPHLRKMIETWRQIARELGIGELYLCRVESDNDELHDDPRSLGFDAAVEFGVEWRYIGAQNPASASVSRHDYADTAHRILQRRQPEYRRWSGVATGFDNSPRKQAAVCLEGATPQAYQEWVAATIERDVRRNPDENEILLFVNAWNEWAEGAVLEPCQLWGHGFAEAHAAGVAQGMRGDVELQALASENFADLTVGIVTECNAQQLMDCLTVALETTRDAGRVQFVVIDNASSDATADLLRELASDVTSYRFHRKADPITAWDKAGMLARSDDVVLVSPDVLLQPGWLARAQEALKNESCPGITLDLHDGTFPIGANGFESTSRVAMLLKYSRVRGTQTLNFPRAPGALAHLAQPETSTDTDTEPADWPSSRPTLVPTNAQPA